MRDHTFSHIGMARVIRELLKFKKWMDKINKEFFFVGGTCLSLVREGKLFDFDKDIDIGILGEEDLYIIERYAKALNYYDEVHIPVENPEKGKILWIKKYIGKKYIIIFELAAQYQNDYCVFYNRMLGESWQYLHGHLQWPKHLFEAFEYIPFAGEIFNLPHPAEEFLETFYGNDWRTPKQYTDWRYNCRNIFPGWK